MKPLLKGSRIEGLQAKKQLPNQFPYFLNFMKNESSADLRNNQVSKEIHLHYPISSIKSIERDILMIPIDRYFRIDPLTGYVGC
jgi:hypothetical protein